MSSDAELSTAPPEHPALDYAFLRGEGIRTLERLVGHAWNDFNAHDPGITILEQLCYAITDLAYRASYELPDLLAGQGGDPYRSLYSAATILTSDPVTLLDLRKLVIDVDGVRNAWIEPIAEPAPALQFRADKHEIGFLPDPPYTVPVARKGLLRVAVETSDLLDRPVVEVQRDVARRLAAHRAVCSEIEDIQVLAGQPIQVFAEVEIGAVDDAEGVLLAIYQALWDDISPAVAFRSLGELLAAGARSDEIFDGPRLDHGFLDSAALSAMTRRTQIHTSDLIRAIMAIPGVRTVRSIAVAAGTAGRQPWSLAIDPARTPRLDLAGSSITLVKGRLTAALDVPRIVDALIEQRKQAASRGPLPAGDRDFPLPAGRDRHVARYHSIQHQFPALYGIGSAGLPESASARRSAQAKQLKAYLLLFDQLLAGGFAQLAHAASLFAFDAQDTRTYATQVVEDDPESPLGLSALRTFDPQTHAAHLEAITNAGDDPRSLSSREHRFLNHLLARFAEQFADTALVAGRTVSDDADRLVRDKQAFLQRYPRISSARGTGIDTTRPEGADPGSGLAERLARKLGLAADRGERMLVVEHLLLAPIAEDNLPPGALDYRQIPALADATSRDPYSLQLSILLPGWRGRMKQADAAPSELRILVEHTIREETPSHLTPYVHWLDDTAWPVVETAYDDWRDAYRGYRAARLGLELTDDPRYFRMRDARDRLIDLLGFGTTYPLRDLPVRDDRLTVPFNQPARIPIDASQRGVTYELHSDKDDRADAVLATADGTGGTIYLETPAMREDATFNILARKLAPAREVYLLHQATVKVGLDVTLPARILAADLLDPSVDRLDDAAARIVDWGTRVAVQIDHSQEGVDYQLVQITDGHDQPLSATVRGDLGDIQLTADAAGEDVELRIRATKTFDPSEHRATQTALLDAVLPLKVRARPDLAVAAEPSALVEFASAPNVRIDATQASASYQLYLRPVSDRDYVFGAPPADALGADVDGAPRVLVPRPPRRPIWAELDGFAPVGAAVPGTGGALRLAMPALRDDAVVVVRAQKAHRAGAATLTSSVQLAQAALILVRPDPQPALRLGVAMAGARTAGTVELTGGQAGVRYELATAVDGTALGLPGYFHKTDESNPAANKGIGADASYGLRIAVDLAISRGTQRPAMGRDELATTPPLPPLITTGPLDPGTTLYVRAVKAHTRAAVRLSRTAPIDPVPQIAANPAVVDAGSSATIVVRASATGERYQLAQAGQLLGPARDGNGSDLTWTTGAVLQTTSFQMLVTRPAQSGIPVQRTVQVAVKVTPILSDPGPGPGLPDVA